MSLKEKTFNGVIWSAVEIFSIKGMQFVIGIILARLLLPSDYGLIGMLTIFLAISQSFIDSGFSSALIQKKDRTETDFSTVFYFNFAIAFLLYIVLFFSSPLIAIFFHQPLLVPLTKVIGINIVIASLAIVQRSKLSIELDFKTQAKASFLSVVIGGFVGIFMAYKGYGVWSLVWQTIVRNVFNTVFLWIYSKWKPEKKFSMNSFKSLFSFGSKLLVAGLLNTIYLNIYQIIIGKLFNVESLGFYTRAKQFQQLPSKNVTSIIQKVTYPVLSSIQNDEMKLVQVYRKFIKLSAFVIFPLMLGMFAIAKPMIIVLLTEKWLPVVPLLKLLAIAGMLYPIHAINLNILNVKGRSDLFLRLEIIKKVITTIIILITFSFGIKALILGQIATSIIALFINTYYSNKLVKYGTWQQIKDLIPFAFMSLIMLGSIQILNYFLISDLLKLILGIPFGIFVYSISAFVGKFDELYELKNLVLSRIYDK